MQFYVGLHQPGDAKHFERAFISVNRVRRRKSPVPCGDWIMDSGAFTELTTHGTYRHGAEEYAAEVNRLALLNPGLKVVVAQDYMCEPFVLKITGLTVAEHQRLTIERYDELRALVASHIYLMPVLQGYAVDDYVHHIEQYGDRLPYGAYVGVGSVCKRNGDVRQVEAILSAIKAKRPDLLLHGFGLKITALKSELVRELLHTADSMAWSFSARKQGRSANDWREADAFSRKIEAMSSTLTAWSYSRYAKYATCPLQFKLSVIDKIKEPASPAMERGNKTHQAIAAYLTGATPTLPSEIKLPFHHSLYAEMRAFPDKLVEHQQGFTRQWKPTGWFSKDIWYRQIYDVALLYEDLTAEAIDHKMGKKYGSNDEQMELQALSLMCQFKPATHVTTRLVYIDSGEEEIAEFPAAERDALKSKWERKVEPMFNDTVFAPRPNEKCRFCHFSRSKAGPCRFG